MNKNEFIRKLKDGLVGLNQTDKREILLDYEEHFLDGKKSGRTDDEICESLGNPAEIAANIKNETKHHSSVNTDGVNTAGYIIGIIALGIASIWLVGLVIGLIVDIIGGIVGTTFILALPFTVPIKIASVSALIFGMAIAAMIIFGLIMLTILIMRWFKAMINGLAKEEDKKIKREFKMFKVSGWIWTLLVIIAVISLGGVIYGAVTVGLDTAGAVFRGDFDDIIEDIDRFEYFDSHEDFEKYFKEYEGNNPFGIFFKDGVFDEDGLDISGFFIPNGKNVDITKNLDLSGVDNIVVSASSIGIDIVEGEKANAMLTGRSRFATEKLNIEVKGDTLYIQVIQSKRPFSNAWLNLEVTLPDEVYGKLIVDNSSGSTEVIGIKAAQLDIDASSGSIMVDGEGYSYALINIDNLSGRIELNDVADADLVKLNNASGSIIVNSVVADMFDIDSSSGRVVMDEIEGDMMVKGTSGSISINGALGDGETVVRTASGRIVLNLDEEPMAITAETTSGHVKVEESFLLKASLISNHAYVAQYSDKTVKTPSLYVKTTSGSISIYFN